MYYIFYNDRLREYDRKDSAESFLEDEGITQQDIEDGRVVVFLGSPLRITTNVILEKA